jgi:DNA-binding NarL/FixJ family response regulator
VDPGTDTIKVVIADDHAPTRAGVRMSLERGGFDVVAEAEDAPGAVAACVRERPDVALLDVYMPGNGIRAAAEIAERAPATAVVMLTISQDDQDLFDALRAGAAGFLSKDTDPNRLAPALRGVLAGEAALPRKLTMKLIDAFRDRARRRSAPVLEQRGIVLTEREWEVVEGLASGEATGRIADRLGISPVTVRRHLSSVMSKLGVEDRDAALALLRGREEPRRRGRPGD